MLDFFYIIKTPNRSTHIWELPLNVTRAAHTVIAVINRDDKDDYILRGMWKQVDSALGRIFVGEELR